jgi:hypothetical protein
MTPAAPGGEAAWDDREILASPVRIARIDSPFGQLTAASTDRGLVRLAFPHEAEDELFEQLATHFSSEVEAAPADPTLLAELAGYFSGRVRRFTARLDRRLIAGESRTDRPRATRGSRRRPAARAARAPPATHWGPTRCQS